MQPATTEKEVLVVDHSTRGGLLKRYRMVGLNGIYKLHLVATTPYRSPGERRMIVKFWETRYAKPFVITIAPHE
jgi:hypothetical protein